MAPPSSTCHVTLPNMARDPPSIRHPPPHTAQVLDTSFIVDFALGFRTAFLDHGWLIKLPKLTARRYASPRTPNSSHRTPRCIAPRPQAHRTPARSAHTHKSSLPDSQHAGRQPRTPQAHRVREPMGHDPASSVSLSRSRRYVHSIWFPWDLLSAIPLDLLFEFTGDGLGLGLGPG